MNDRISREGMMMNIARDVSARSTCDRLHVGAVIARDHRPIVTGYNGAPAGMDHCDHSLNLYDFAHNEPKGCEVAVHAEANAIAYAARLGIPVEGAELFVTHQPCLKCSQLLINAGISRVMYAFPYRKPEGIQLLHQAGILVQKWAYHDD